MTLSLLSGAASQGRGGSQPSQDYQVTAPSPRREDLEGLLGTKEAEWKVSTEKMLVCLLLCKVISVFTYTYQATAFFLSVGSGLFPFPAAELLFARLPSRGGLEPCVPLAAPFSVTGRPGAQVTLGKPEMAARQVSCWFPCSSVLLLAEQNLIIFFSLMIIMGCEEQLLN